MRIVDLDTMDYEAAWQEQCRHHDEVVAGGEEVILMVEHPPVVTLGRRAEQSMSHLKCDPAELKRRGIQLVHSDRGGDVTYHGPGQLVCYPIVRLIDHGLSVGGYMKLLQQAVIDTLAKLHITSHVDCDAVGIWVDPVTGDRPAEKICSLGVRVRKGVTLHGLALNVETDLSAFEVIVPCGISDRRVTSIRKLRHDDPPSFLAVKSMLGKTLIAALKSAGPPPVDGGAGAS